MFGFCLILFYNIFMLLKRRFYLNYSKNTNTFLFILVLAIAITVVLYSLQYLASYASTADEGYYLRYTTFIKFNGLKGFPILYKDFIGNKQHWLFPPPSRLGFIMLCYIFANMCGCSFEAISLLSVFSYSLLLIVCYYFSKRHFGSKMALLFTILMAFSPLNMAVARRALTDSTAYLLSAFSIWLFYDLLKRTSTLKYILFIIVFSLAVLVKELTIILSFAFVLYLLYLKFFTKETFNIKNWFGVTLFPYLIVGCAYVISAGGIKYAIEIMKIVLASPKTNQYAILLGAGPWYRYIIDFVLLSPWVFILGAGFPLYYILKKKPDEKIRYFIFISMFVFIFLSSCLFTKNIRYVILLDMVLRLFSVLMLKEIFETRFPKYCGTFTTLAVIAIAVFDFLTFVDLFIVFYSLFVVSNNTK